MSTPADYWLSPGQHMEWHGAYRYAKRDRECKTVDNSHGRRLHFRVVGHEKMAATLYNPISVFFPDP